MSVFYAQIHDPSGEKVVSYEGMEQSVVDSLLTEKGIPFDFISETAYNAFILSHLPVPLTPVQLVALFRALAINLMDSPDPSQKVLRALLLVLIDELNILRQRDRDRSADVAAAASLADLKTRWAARSALADRDITQVKPAIQNKINSGLAD